MKQIGVNGAFIGFIGDGSVKTLMIQLRLAVKNDGRFCTWF